MDKCLDLGLIDSQLFIKFIIPIFFGNLVDRFGLKRVAQELLYFEIGYLPRRLIAGRASQFPGPGTPFVSTMKSLYSLGLMVQRLSLSVEPKSQVPGAGVLRLRVPRMPVLAIFSLDSPNLYPLDFLWLYSTSVAMLYY